MALTNKRWQKQTVSMIAVTDGNDRQCWQTNDSYSFSPYCLCVSPSIRPYSCTLFDTRRLFLSFMQFYQLNLLFLLTMLWFKTALCLKINHSLSHKLGSERGSKWMNECSGARDRSEQCKASSVEQANEWAVKVNERMDERVTQYLRLDSWLFWTIVC